jgi:pilus biogenesis lipoprotein CpaD
MVRSRRLLPVMIATALAGCAAPRFPERADAPSEARHAEYVATLTLPASGDRLTEDERAALRAMPAPHPDGGPAQATLTAPPSGAVRMAEAAETLEAAGAATATLIDPAARALTISAPRYSALSNRCADWSGARLAHPLDPLWEFAPKTASLSLGCATAANLSAMIAEPRDLTEPRPAGLADAAAGAGENHDLAAPCRLPFGRDLRLAAPHVGVQQLGR